METNKSLSARIKRRNRQGFEGIGTLNDSIPTLIYGDYTDPEQNHKDVDYSTAKRRKNKLGMKYVLNYDGTYYTTNKRSLNKKYADGHQKLKK